MYQINGSGVWKRVFAVPTDVVDNHIRVCGPLSLKVLLILLRHEAPMDAKELAKILNQSVTDVKDAINYWIDLGIIAASSKADLPKGAQERKPEPEPAATPAAAAEAEPAKPRERMVRIGRSRPRLGTREINEMARDDANIGTLIREAQAAFGRTLRPIESETVTTLYCYDGMSPDVILMLLQYCISIGKSSMGYVEKVAADWMEREIDSHEKAELEILRLSEASEQEGLIRSTFGIYGRKISDKEAALFHTWTGEMGFSVQMIQLAYERCIESKAKLSFAYINGILSDWHKKGIATPDAAQRDMQEGGGRNGKGGQEPQASYDLDQFEQVIKQGNIWD